MPDTATLWKYVSVFAALIAAGMGMPIPEEVPVTVGERTWPASEKWRSAAKRE